METQYTFDENTVSDLHKDAYGYRPRGDFWSFWTDASDETKQLIWDELIEDLGRSIQDEKSAQQTAIAATEVRIKSIMDMVAGSTRADAIRFLDDAHDCRGDISFLEYHLGVPYGYLSGVKPGFLLGPVLV